MKRKVKVNYDIQYESFTNEKGETFKIGDTIKVKTINPNLKIYGYIITIFDNAVLIADSLSQEESPHESLMFYKKERLEKTDYIYIPKVFPTKDFIESAIEIQKYNPIASLN